MRESSKNKTRKNKIQKNKTNKRYVYNKNDYSKDSGMLTTIWGPSLWHFLHTMSFNYPVHPTRMHKREYKKFIITLKYILPCKYCRENLRKNFKKLPLTHDKLKNRHTFSKYIYDLHEVINKMLNKKSSLTYNDVRERYEHFRSRCTLKNKQKNYSVNTKLKKLFNKTKKEKGCTEPVYGNKSKCMIKIVPQNTKGKSLTVDKKCLKKK